MKRCRFYLYCVFPLLLLSCATGYSSLRDAAGNSFELIIADEQTILDVASDAIQNRFPDTAISRLAGRDKGYTFYTQPAIDRTTFKFTLIRASGTTQDGTMLTGYSYSIRSYGTQFFVEQRYVEPLKAEIDRMLYKKGVTLTRVQSIKFEPE